MGASLPVLARALEAGPDAPAARVGRLYAANTAGACLGPVLAVFVLFPVVGLSRALWLAGGLNVVVAVLLLLNRARLRPEVALPETPVGAPPADRGDPLVAATLAVSGGAAMVYEVAWSRTLASVFGSSAYGVAIMLSVFLVGLAGGSALASVWLGRRGRRVVPGVLAWLLIGTAGAAFVSLLVARRLPFAFLVLHEALTGAWAPFLTQFALSAAHGTVDLAPGRGVSRRRRDHRSPAGPGGPRIAALHRQPPGLRRGRGARLRRAAGRPGHGNVGPAGDTARACDGRSARRAPGGAGHGLDRRDGIRSRAGAWPGSQRARRSEKLRLLCRA